MISGRGWSTLACCRESSRAEKWSSNGPLAGRSMGASGAGAPNQPELPAAANLPLVHPIALPVSLGIVDQPVALADEVVVQRPQGGPKLARRCDGAPAVRLAPEVMRDGADAIEADPGVPGLAVPQSPAQALDLLGDHRLRRGALRIVGRQAAGDLCQVLQPHGEVEPVQDRKFRDAGVEEDAPQPGAAVGERGQYGLPGV